MLTDYSGVQLVIDCSLPSTSKYIELDCLLRDKTICNCAAMRPHPPELSFSYGAVLCGVVVECTARGTQSMRE